MGCCCSTAKWKREVVQDHKFDFVDVKVFYDSSPIRRITYCFIFLVVIKAILMYCADIWTAYLLIKSDGMSKEKDILIPLDIRRWLYLASIAVSFILLLWEGKKARRIIASRDIAYAYTNIAAFRFYSIRSYSHYCFFSQIGVTQSLKDRIAYFVYFTLKGWKRMLLADAPRQVLNAINIWATATKGGHGIDWAVFRPTSPQDVRLRTSFFTSTFSFALWCITAVFTVIACFLYVPLLCNIRGNLKEYVCHKIDKRIANLLLRKSRKRILEQQRDQRRIQEEMLRAQGKDVTSKAAITAVAGRQPTLPTLNAVDNNSRPISAMVRPNPSTTNKFADKRPAPAVYRRPSIESVSTTYSSVSRQPLVHQDPNYASAHPMPPMPVNQDPYGRAAGYGQQQQNYQRAPPMHAEPSRFGHNNHTNDYDDTRSDYSGARDRPGRPYPPNGPAGNGYDDGRSDYGGSEYAGSHRGGPNHRPPPPPHHIPPPIDTSRYGGPPRAPYARSDFGGSDAGSNYGGDSRLAHQHNNHHYNAPQTPSGLQNRYGNGPNHTPTNEAYAMLPPRRPASPTGSVSSMGSGRYGGRPHHQGDNRSNYGDESDDDGASSRYGTRGRPQRNYGNGNRGNAQPMPRQPQPHQQQQPYSSSTHRPPYGGGNF